MQYERDLQAGILHLMQLFNFGLTCVCLHVWDTYLGFNRAVQQLLLLSFQKAS